MARAFRAALIAGLAVTPLALLLSPIMSSFAVPAAPAAPPAPTAPPGTRLPTPLPSGVFTPHHAGEPTVGLFDEGEPAGPEPGKAPVLPASPEVANPQVDNAVPPNSSGLSDTAPGGAVDPAFSVGGATTLPADRSPSPSDTVPSPPNQLGVAGAASAVKALPPDRRLRYVVIPHPDDEFESWSLIQSAPDHYTVFILLTQGEATSLCSGGGILHTPTGDQTAFGERLPLPQPFAGKGTKTCALERVNSFHAFLDEMAAIDPALDRPSFVGLERGEVRPGDLVEPGAQPASPGTVDTTFALYVGERSARMIFNLGDGRLTAAKVTWAVQTARRMRARFPVSVEDDVVGSAYYNPDDPGYVLYSHPDHFAVQQALFLTDQHTPGPQWGRTTPVDANRRVRAFVDSNTYCAVMCVGPLPDDPLGNPKAKRLGIYQRVYGWIAFTSGTTNANTYWASSFAPTLSIFSQAQDFWHRFGDAGRASLIPANRVTAPATIVAIAVFLVVAVPVVLRRRRRAQSPLGG